MKFFTLLLFPIILMATEMMDINGSDLLEKLNKHIQQSSYYEAEFNDFVDILEKVETKSILDRLNFTPEVQTRIDSLHYTLGEIAGENTKIYNNSDSSLNGLYRRKNYTKQFSPSESVRFKLNADGSILDSLSFHGRILFHHGTQSNERLCILSRDIKSGESTTEVDFDRAYFDYMPNKGSDYAFTFSFGVLPTTGGTPMQYAQKTSRKSMFPALVFDMNTFGFIATQKLAEKTFARAILAKGYTLNPNMYIYQCNRENIDNADILGGYIDTRFTFLGDALVSFGLNRLGNLKAHPYLGPDVTADDAHILGDVLTFGAGIDIENFIINDAVFFAHIAMSKPFANGAVDDYQIVSDTNQTLADGKTADGSVGFSESSYAKGTLLGQKGYAVYMGAKYTLFNTLDLGLEYNWGSQYWFSATQGAEDMFNKLATRGNVIETYALWNFNKYFFLKTGYMVSKEDYTGSGWHFGSPVAKDATQSIGYIVFNAKF